MELSQATPTAADNWREKPYRHHSYTVKYEGAAYCLCGNSKNHIVHTIKCWKE